MKKLLLCLSLVLMIQVGFLYSVPYGPFTSWSDVIARSPQIVIVKSTKLPETDIRGLAGAQDSEVQVEYILKGITNRVSTNLPHLGKALLDSAVRPREGEHYLVFSLRFDEDRYQAIEDFRIVPIGLDFSTNLVAGKTLADQVRAILMHRLEQLNRQANLTSAEEAEKRRLQSGLDQ